MLLNFLGLWFSKWPASAMELCKDRRHKPVPIRQRVISLLGMCYSIAFSAPSKKTPMVRCWPDAELRFHARHILSARVDAHTTLSTLNFAPLSAPKPVKRRADQV